MLVTAPYRCSDAYKIHQKPTDSCHGVEGIFGTLFGHFAYPIAMINEHFVCKKLVKKSSITT